MKIPLLTSFLAGMAITAFAQSSAQPDGTPFTLPPGPLVKPFPSMIRWTITRKGSSSAAAKPNATSGPGETQNDQKAATSSFDMRIVGEKAGDVSHIVTTYGNGTKTEVWSKGGQQTTMITGWNQPVVSAAAPAEAEDLDWISQANFAGIQNVSGQKCMVFRDKIIPANLRGVVKLSGTGTKSSDAPIAGPNNAWVMKPTEKLDTEILKVDAVACIELNSRLPVALQVGKVVTSYQYQPLPPTYVLNLPADSQAAISDRAAKVRAQIRKPVLP